MREINTTVCPNSSIHLNASGGISYQWINPININNFMIHNPIASPDDSITYYVNITDSNNCINIDSVSVKIYEEPEADVDLMIIYVVVIRINLTLQVEFPINGNHLI